MNCLWCDGEILADTTWANLFLPPKDQYLCHKCEGELEVLTGKRCSRCSRPSEEGICQDCDWWNKFTHGNDTLSLNYSVFGYNERMQDMIAKWKYRGDYQLGNAYKEMFVSTYMKNIKSEEKFTAVPIPLSEERLQERCFNQAEMLASFLPIKTVEALTRVHGEKQSKKTRHERIQSTNPFKIQKAINTPVILVDDIYTTGSTIRHAASLLKQHGCPKIYAYTLIRG